MKSVLYSFLSILAALGCQGALAGDAVQGFNKLKLLAGNWELTDSSGHTHPISYEVVSDGSALLEKHMGMVSVYHLDQDSIMMTHYCAAKNQPRMRVTDFSAADTTLDFNFVDITNLKPGDGHINHLTIKFISKDEVEEAWSYVDGSGATSTDVFKLKRSQMVSEAGSDVIAWFEIPVTDLTRALNFYSTVLDLKFNVQDFEGKQMAFFPFEDGKISGALVKAPDLAPSSSGSLVFLKAGQDLSVALNRVVAAGGQVIQAKTLIDPNVGYYAILQDTEGNRVALFSHH